MSEIEGKLAMEKLFGAEFLSAVGLLFITAGAAEHALALQFARLIAHPNKLDPAMVAALGYVETRAQMQQIRIIARWRLTPERFQEAMNICDRIQDSFDRRNELAHWVYTPGAGSDKAVLRTVRIKRDGSLVPPKPYTAQQIRGFADMLLNRLAEFDRVLNEAGLRKLDPGDFVQPEIEGQPPAP
jgi:hypothetical protein